MRLDHLLSKGNAHKSAKRWCYTVGFSKWRPECTLKIAYQTQICKREIFYRGEPRNQRQKWVLIRIEFRSRKCSVRESILSKKKVERRIFWKDKRITSKRKQFVADELVWSSEEERREDALAPGAEEGRDKLRKAAVRSKYPMSRRYPNGGTRLRNTQSL